MVLPIAQKAQAPVLVIDLQPTEAMDHATFDTGQWLAYCGQCPVPEVANVFRRAGIPFRSVSGYLRQESAWDRINQWVHAAGVRATLRNARHGLMGHLYPGMLDVSTDLTPVSTTFGSHVEVLEFDDLRVRVAEVTDDQVRERMELARSLFTLDHSVNDEDFAWGAKVSVGLDRLVDDFDLDSVAYYHRGLAGEQHERLGAGMILGASLLTARGIPMAGEYELRTSIAMLAGGAIGAGGSFCEIQALNFFDNVVEMGHDGPAHLAVSAREPLLRGSASITASAAGASRSSSTSSTARSRRSASGDGLSLCFRPSEGGVGRAGPGNTTGYWGGGRGGGRRRQRGRPGGPWAARPRRASASQNAGVRAAAGRWRVCFQLQVRPERIAEYRERHAAVWPEMLRALKDAGWNNYSLFLREDGLLIGYLETPDLAAAQAGMAATEVNARWQAQMGDFFVDLDGTPDAGFLQLTEMFNLEDQLAALDVAPRERSSS